MYYVRVEDTFSAAHYLKNYHGKCERLHGHNYRVRVTVSGKELEEGGMVLDFKILKRKLREILKREDLVRMLKAILESTPPLKVSDIASKLSITIDAARRRLRLIRNAGIGIGMDVNHYGLGLTKLFITVDGILDEIPAPLSYIIKWRAYIISPRPLTMMIFYQPINVDKKYILQSLPHRKVINVFEAQLTICNKPNFAQYFDPEKNEFVFPWDEIKIKISKCIAHASRSG